jgi:DNA relaxase NicK
MIIIPKCLKNSKKVTLRNIPTPKKTFSDTIFSYPLLAPAFPVLPVYLTQKNPKNPPFINKGGIDLSDCFSSYSCLTPPTLNLSVIVDYLTFTFPFSTSGQQACNVLDIPDFRRSDPVQQLIVDNVEFERQTALKAAVLPSLAADWDANFPHWRENWVDTKTLTLSGQLALMVEKMSLFISDLDVFECGFGYSGYKYSANLTRDGQCCGKMAWGGNAGTIMISLTGGGCSGVDMYRMRGFLEKLPSVKITRIDLAYDDLLGAFSVGQVKRQYFLGSFHIRGAAPSFKNIDTSTGQTFYIGKKTSGKELCVYEKGKQLGDLTSPWVRFEGRFYASDGKVLVLDMLTNSASYLSGMYPPLRFLSEKHERITAIKEQLKVSLAHLIKHASIGYGKLVNVLKECDYSSDEIVNLLIRDGTPMRLYMPAPPCPF